MKLRTYLVKRTIHMVITILIVLVLLFVLYRLMPGDLAKTMMMNPKMSANDIDKVLVRYGFGKWTDYPGQYTETNYIPQHIGHYSVTVQATGDNGQTDSFSTAFDVNAPEDADYVSPLILDIGVTSASIGQKAEFYAWAHDDGAIRSVEITLICANQTVVDGSAVPFTQMFSLVPDESMTDEINRTYYYSGSSSLPLSLGQDGNSDFMATFRINDQSRNLATAAVHFNGTNGVEISKVWGLSANIPYDDGIYTYPVMNQAVSLSAKAMGGTPSFTMASPDGATPEAITGMAGTLNFTGNHVVTRNGMLLFNVKIGDISAVLPIPVNSASTAPQPVNDNDSTYPLLSNLEIVPLNQQGREILSPVYPFPLENIRLRINATAINENGNRCSNVTALIIRPDGNSVELTLLHPNYVKLVGYPEQFAVYMKTMLVFDFGTSYIYQRNTWEVILERVPSTMLLFGSAMIVSYVLGITIGVIVAWRRGTVLEMGTIIVTLFFYSMPIFWFALIMQWVFYSQLGWFPLAGMGGVNPATGEALRGLEWFISVLHHLTMPLITLVILGLAGTILLMRSAMLEVIGEDFTTTAKAKGLKERQVVFRHVARNAMLPVVTSMAMSIGGIISGGVLTETIFSWYGMGTLLIEGTMSKDFPVVQGAFYIMALLTIVGNMGADILYAWLDPRVQL